MTEAVRPCSSKSLLARNSAGNCFGIGADLAILETLDAVIPVAGVAKVESYLAYARAAGNPAPIETVTYPGAYHAWTVPSLVTLRFYPEYVSTKKCPLILLGPNRPVLLIDGQAKPFDPSSSGPCLGKAPDYWRQYDPPV